MVASRSRRKEELSPRTVLIEPFDLMMHATEEGVTALQQRFSAFGQSKHEFVRLYVSVQT